MEGKGNRHKRKELGKEAERKRRGKDRILPGLIISRGGGDAREPDKKTNNQQNKTKKPHS